MGVLDREYLGMGAEVQKFEQDLTTFFSRQALCVVNGTAALHLALQAAGVGRGCDVLVPSLTYVASFQAIAATGARAIPCDIGEDTLTLDVKDAEKRLTPQTKAIMPVHYAGGVGKLDALYDFARKKGLRVIEDAAHAFGTVYEGKRVGGFGDIACFSFDGIKNITSGEGGCVVTDDQNIIRKVSDARLLGVEKDSEKRYAGARSWSFDVTAQGWRYHMSNVMAAIGIVQLQRFSHFAAIRQQCAKKYDSLLKDSQAIRILKQNYDEVVPHIYPVILPDSCNRETVIAFMAERNIQTGIHYQPNHTLSYFKFDGMAIPAITEKIGQRLLTLPLHPDVTDDDVQYVVKNLLESVQ